MRVWWWRWRWRMEMIWAGPWRCALLSAEWAGSGNAREPRVAASPHPPHSSCTGRSPTAGRLQNFLALIPLALFLGEVTEDLAVRFGHTIGGLLNATFGNVVEL